MRTIAGDLYELRIESHGIFFDRAESGLYRLFRLSRWLRFRLLRE
jgi:hypothetical protein